MCVGVWVCSGDEKASNDPWVCGKPPPVWSNHSLLSIVPPPSLPLSNSPNPPPLVVASHLPSIIPISLVRELGWHLVAPLSYLSLLKNVSASHPLFPVHWLVYGGWHWASSVSCPISHFSLAEGCRFLSVGLPSSRVTVFTPPLFFAAELSLPLPSLLFFTL